MPLMLCKGCVFYNKNKSSFDYTGGEGYCEGACMRHPPSCFAAYGATEAHRCVWSSGYPHVEEDDGCGDGEVKQ